MVCGWLNMDARPLGMKSWMNSLLKVPGGLNPRRRLVSGWGCLLIMTLHCKPYSPCSLDFCLLLLMEVVLWSNLPLSFIFSHLYPFTQYCICFKWEVKLVTVTPSWLEAKVVSRGLGLLPALLHCHLCTERVPLPLCTSWHISFTKEIWRKTNDLLCKGIHNLRKILLSERSFTLWKICINLWEQRSENKNDQ